MARRFLALVVALAVLALPAIALAAPMSTDLTTVRADSVTVVTGKVRWVPTPAKAPSVVPGYQMFIDVDGTLRGTAPSSMPVDDSPDGHVFVGDERVVAFVNAQNQLRWIARLLAGPDLEHGVLQLQGFFDFNAHLVHPGMMTFAELKAYLASGVTPKEKFSASIAFPDGHGGYRATARHLTIDWDPIARSGTVSGFAPACLSFNTLWGLDWGRVEALFGDTCSYGNTSRTLRLDGTPTGVDAAGAITVDLVPQDPLLLESEFDAYVADGHQANVTRVVRVAIAGGGVWSWRIREGLVDSGGKLHAAGGMGSSSGDKQVGGNTITTYEEYWEFGDATIRLSRSAPHGTSIPSIGTDSALLAAIDAGGWTCTFERKGVGSAACTLTAGTPIVVRR